MMDALFGSTTVPMLEQVVNFAQQRHGLLAGNIANMDTPGYKVRDLSQAQFEENLKKAIEQRDDASEMANASPGNIGRYQPDPFAQMEQSPGEILYHDGSNDSLEHQVMTLSKNQMQHNLAISIMSSQFRLLQTAISERV